MALFDFLHSAAVFDGPMFLRCTFIILPISYLILVFTEIHYHGVSHLKRHILFALLYALLRSGYIHPDIIIIMFIACTWFLIIRQIYLNHGKRLYGNDLIDPEAVQENNGTADEVQNERKRFDNSIQFCTPEPENVSTDLSEAEVPSINEVNIEDLKTISPFTNHNRFHCGAKPNTDKYVKLAIFGAVYGVFFWMIASYIVNDAAAFLIASLPQLLVFLIIPAYHPGTRLEICVTGFVVKTGLKYRKWIPYALIKTLTLSKAHNAFYFNIVAKDYQGKVLAYESLPGDMNRVASLFSDRANVYDFEFDMAYTDEFEWDL